MPSGQECVSTMKICAHLAREKGFGIVGIRYVFSPIEWSFSFCYLSSSIIRNHAYNNVCHTVTRYTRKANVQVNMMPHK